MAEVRRNDERHEYELLDGDQVIGKAVYDDQGGAVVITHTSIDEDREGEGLGSQLARAALGDLRAQGKQVIPQCPFILAYIQRHPEYRELVPPNQRGAFGLS